MDPVIEFVSGIVAAGAIIALINWRNKPRAEWKTVGYQARPSMSSRWYVWEIEERNGVQRAEPMGGMLATQFGYSEAEAKRRAKQYAQDLVTPGHLDGPVERG